MATNLQAKDTADSAAYQNVQVVVRMRPMNEAEKKDPYRNPCVRMDSVHGEIAIDNADMSKASIPKTKRYTFDRVFDDKTTQTQLFDNAVAPVVDEVLRGYSCCIFAYGQTGTGKTHTMEGVRREDGTFDSESDDAGIIPRAVRNVFNHLENKVQQDPSFEYVVKMSFLEIYNEKLDDLLSPESSTFQEQGNGTNGPMGFSSGGHGSLINTNNGITGNGKTMMNSTSAMNGRSNGTTIPSSSSLMDDDDTSSNTNFIGRDRLKIISDDKFGQRVAGLEEITVKSPKECFMHFHKGIAKRATAETKCNAASSRSHCVFTLTITMKELWNGQDMLRVGKLNLVDLAGSECVGRSGATERRAREAGNINQSLLTLGRVITALVEKSHHIPYRDSKLTRLLQDSLGGKTKTCIIATVGPAPSALEETVSTLEYANRAKNIKNRPEAHARVEKRDVVASAYMELERLRARFRQQIEAQDGMISVKEDEYNNMSSRIECLESQLKDLETLKVATETELKEVRGILENTKELLEMMRIKQQETEAALVQTTETLNVRTNELTDERTVHDETKVVLRATTQTENLLTNQAQGVLSTLQMSVKDISGLHAKVQRTQTVLTTNRHSGDMFATSAANRLNSLASNAAVFNTSTQGKLASLKDNSSVFLTNRIQDNQQLSNALNRIRNDIVNYSRFTTANATSYNEEYSKLSTEGRSVMETTKQTSTANLDSMVMYLTQSFDTIQEKLNQQTAALQAWNTLSNQTFTDLRTSLTQFADHHTEEIASLTELVTTGAKEVDATLANQANMVQSFRVQQEQNTKEAANNLLAQVSSLVNTFVTNQTNTTSTVANTLLGQTNDARKSVKMVHDRVIDNINTHQSSTTTWIQTAQQYNDTSLSNFTDQFTNVSALLQSTNDELIAAGSKKAQVHSTSQSIIDSLVGTAYGNMDNQQKLMNGYISKTKSASVSANETGSKNCESLGQQFIVNDTRIRNYVDNVTANNNEISSLTDNYTESIKGWVAEEGIALHSFFTSTLVDDVPTGRTPAKRDYAAPSAFVATSPADMLVNRYRQAKSEGVATPERDARVFSSKPLPPMANLVVPRDRTSTSGNSSSNDTTNPTLHHSQSAAALLSLTRYRSTSSMANIPTVTANPRLSIESTRSRTSIGSTLSNSNVNDSAMDTQVITNCNELDFSETNTNSPAVVNVTGTESGVMETNNTTSCTDSSVPIVVVESTTIETIIPSVVPSSNTNNNPGTVSLPASPVVDTVPVVPNETLTPTVNTVTVNSSTVTSTVPSSSTGASTNNAARNRLIALGSKAKANALATAANNATVNPPVVPDTTTPIAPPSATVTNSLSSRIATTASSTPCVSTSVGAAPVSTTKVVAANMKSSVVPSTSTAEKSPAPSPSKSTRSKTNPGTASNNNENMNTVPETTTKTTTVPIRESRLHRPSILPTTSATVPNPVAASVTKEPVVNLGATMGRTARRPTATKGDM